MKNKNIFKKFLIGVLAANLILCFNLQAYASDNIEIFPEKNVVKNKIWRVKFNDDLDSSTINNSILVKDKDGVVVDVEVVLLSNKKTLEVRPPKKGYELGKKYTLTVNNTLKSSKGEQLKQGGKMYFYITDGNGNSGGGNNTDFVAEAKVEVSPVISILKSITIKSTNNKNIKKYKVEDNNTLIDIGKAVITIVNKESTNIYFYGEDGRTLLGKGVIDVSSNNDNINITIE